MMTIAKPDNPRARLPAATKFARTLIGEPVTDVGKFVVFKPVSGGYVYGAPNAWLFGPREHFLVTDGQKAAILAAITSSTRPVLWITGTSWIVLSALSATALSLWAYRSGYYVAGLNGVTALIAMVLSIYPAFVISRQLLLRRLRPILATLPPTNERITSLEVRQAMQTVVKPISISPTRRRIVRIASVVVIAAIFGGMIARAIDVYEPNQSKLLTLYLANANLYGLLNIVTIVAFGAVLVTFGRISPETNMSLIRRAGSNEP
jgi:hypothetical protein